MSSKRMPGEGKLGYCRREERRMVWRMLSSCSSPSGWTVVLVGVDIASGGEWEPDAEGGGD